MARLHSRKLIRSTPIVNADGIVTVWRFEVEFVDSATKWSRSYEFDHILPEDSKLKPSDFKQADILGFIPQTYDHIFEAHWQSMHPEPATPVKEEVVVVEEETTPAPTKKVTKVVANTSNTVSK